MSRPIILSILAPLILLVGCTTPDALYCDDITPCTDPARPFCDVNGSFPASSGVGRTCIADPNGGGGDGGLPDAEPSACTASSQCGNVTPICVEEICTSCVPGSGGDSACTAKDSANPICGGDGQCHECTRSLNCSEPNFPICDLSTFTCQACDNHEQCGSGACEMETGRCIADADVIHVNVALGSDGPICGDAADAAACQHLAGDQGAFAKVQGTRRVVVMAPGNYVHDPVLVVDDLQVRIYGNGAQLLPAGFREGPAMDVSGGSNLQLYDLSLQEGNGGSTGAGVLCENSQITFNNVTVRENASAGVNASGCALEFHNSEILDNLREGMKIDGSDLVMSSTTVKNSSLLGLFAENSSLQIQRSQIVENEAGGMRMSNTDFILENSLIAKNGNKTVNPANFAGGIVVANGFNVSPQVIRHCTVVDNESPNILGAAGIDCGVAPSAVSCPSNIVVGNQKPSGSSSATIGCGLRYSNVTGIAIGQGNISVPPTFVSPGTGDYHLAAGSAGIDLGDPASPTTVDIDNQPRPTGGGFDMGADERP